MVMMKVVMMVVITEVMMMINDDVDDDELDVSKKDVGLDNLNAGDGKYGSWLWGHKRNQPRWNPKASKQTSEKNFV